MPTHGEVYPKPRLEEDLSMGDFQVKCPKCRGNVMVISTSEDAMIQPSSIYGFTKYGQENMSMIMGKALQYQLYPYDSKMYMDPANL